MSAYPKLTPHLASPDPSVVVGRPDASAWPETEAPALAARAAWAHGLGLGLHEHAWKASEASHQSNKPRRAAMATRAEPAQTFYRLPRIRHYDSMELTR